MAVLTARRPLYELQRDRKDLMNIIEETARRRNDIVHRADRLQSDPAGKPQDIGYASAKQSVDTIMHVCLALDELVVARNGDLKAEARSQLVAT